jgi:hypothetical protein
MGLGHPLPSPNKSRKHKEMAPLAVDHFVVKSLQTGF